MSTAEQLSEGASTSTASTAPDPLVGSILNKKFKILSLIATGGMGVIYRGEQVALQRAVAVKVLTPTTASSQIDPNFHKRFFLEASILAKIQHPNIVTVFDYGRVEDSDVERYFMAMEYLEGETLFRRLRRNGRIPPPEAINIGRQIARGLREAHKHGVVHRDLKPSNVMLIPAEEMDELVKILDFGLVKVVADDSEELTQQGSFLGSPRFMSPEQISHGKVDLRTDVYSLGVILYQMLCGKVPFEATNSVQILIAHLQQAVPPMRERNPDAEVPEVLEAFVLKCLAKDPEARPVNMDAVIKGLGECAQGMGLSGTFGSTGLATIDSASGIHAPTPKPIKIKESAAAAATTASAEDSSSVGGAARPAEPAPQGKKPVALIAVAAVAALGVAAFLGLRPADPPPQPAAQPTQTAAPSDPPAAHASFVLLLESMPAGAEVVEDDKVLGATPLQLSITNESVKSQPRRLTLRLDGYQPYSIVQGPSDQSVRVVGTLQKLAQPATTAAPTSEPKTETKTVSRSRGGPRTPPPEAPTPPPPTPPKPLDITTER